jgi:hypothetical protein
MPQNFNKPRQWQNASKTNEERQIRVVVCTVSGEPVSGVIFPDIRENTGKFAKMRGI